MATFGDAVTSAFIEIRLARAGDDLEPANMALGMYVINRLLDQWNANGRACYADTFTDYTLTANLSPHTIGPGGTFSVTVRPVEVLAVALSLGGSPAVYTPIAVRDSRWYASQAVPALTSSLPNNVYYEAAWPLGKLYFWGIPTTAYGVRIWTRTLLTSVVQSDTLSMPPGYQTALELTLSEELGPSCGQQVAQSTKDRAKAARALIFGNNDPSLSAVPDAGVPMLGDSGSNYFSGDGAVRAFGMSEFGEAFDS